MKQRVANPNIGRRPAIERPMLSFGVKPSEMATFLASADRKHGRCVSAHERKKTKLQCAVAFAVRLFAGCTATRKQRSGACSIKMPEVTVTD